MILKEAKWHKTPKHVPVQLTIFLQRSFTQRDALTHQGLTSHARTWFGSGAGNKAFRHCQARGAFKAQVQTPLTSLTSKPSKPSCVLCQDWNLRRMGCLRHKLGGHCPPLRACDSPTSFEMEDAVTHPQPDRQNQCAKHLRRKTCTIASASLASACTISNRAWQTSCG